MNPFSQNFHINFHIRLFTKSIYLKCSDTKTDKSLIRSLIITLSSYLQFIGPGPNKMFKQLLSNVVSNISQKLASLNPINNFIKFALDKLFDELILNHQIKYEDFKSGILNLPNLKLNIQQINNKHLFSSPYILHSGRIGNFCMRLPSLSQIDKQSIQIELNDILLQLKPNEDFEEKFHQIIQKIKEMKRLICEDQMTQQEIIENNPQDYFKKTLKQLFLNMRVKAKNIVVLLYMEDPIRNNNQQKKNSSNEKNYNSKPNPNYILFRIPLINIHHPKQSDNLKNTSKSNHLSEIKFDIQMPQLSVHLLNSDDDQIEQGFPFSFPSANHPSTILMFGRTDQNYESTLSKIQTDETVPRIRLSILTDFHHQTKHTSLQFIFPKIQFMLSPKQIFVLSQLVRQLNEFSQILEKTKKQMGFEADEEIRDTNLTQTKKRLNSFRASSSDIFSSICLSVWDSSMGNQPRGNNLNGLRRTSSRSSKKPSNLVDSLLKQSMDLMASVNMFQSQMKHTIQQKSPEIIHQINTELRAVNFSQTTQLNWRVNFMYAYLLKYDISGKKRFLRNWMALDTQKTINQNIECSYFMLFLQQIEGSYHNEGKSISLEISQAKLSHIKLKKSEQKLKQPEQINNDEQSFVDLLSSKQFQLARKISKQTYQNKSLTSENQSKSQQNTKLKFFQLSKDDHFCISDIFRVSQKTSHAFQNEKIKHNRFLPNYKSQKQSLVYAPSIKLSLHQKKVHMKFLQIQATLNTQILTQAIDFYIFVSLYTDPNNSQVKQSNVFRKKLAQEPIKNQIKDNKEKLNKDKKQPEMQLAIDLQQINFVYFQYFDENLSTAVKCYQKSIEIDHTSKCFCQIKAEGFYFYLSRLHFQKKEMKQKISIKKADFGNCNINKSRISQTSSLVAVSPFAQKNEERNFKITIEPTQDYKASNIYSIFPQLTIDLQLQKIKSLIKLFTRQSLILKPVLTDLTSQRIQNKSIPKQLPKKKKSPFQQIYIFTQNLHVYSPFFCVSIKHLFINHYPEKITLVKLASWYLYLNKSHALYITQMKLPRSVLQIVSQYNQHLLQGHISQANLIMEITQNETMPINFSKTRRRQFFDCLAKRKSTFSLSYFYPQSNSEKVNLKQTLLIDFNSSINLNAHNIFRLSEQQKSIQGQIQFLKDGIQSLSQQLKFLSHNQGKNQQQSSKKEPSKHFKQSSKIFKSSQSSQKQEPDKQIKLSPLKINIDIRPIYVDRLANQTKLVSNKKIKDKQEQNNKEINKNSKPWSLEKVELIFSNTRSFLQLELDPTFIKMYPSSKTLYIQSNLSFAFYFMFKNENLNHPEPLFLRQNQLSHQQFIKIATLDNLEFKLQSIDSKNRLNINVNSIKFQSQLQTLSYLRLHFQQFIKHNIGQNYGQTYYDYEEKTQELKQDEIDEVPQLKSRSSSKVEDMTNGQIKYMQLSEQKKQVQKQYKNKKFLAPRLDNYADLFIQSFKINSITFKLVTDADKFLNLNLKNLCIISKFHEVEKKSKIQALVKLASIDLSYHYKGIKPGVISSMVSFFSTDYAKEDLVFPIIKSLLQQEITLLFQKTENVTFLKMDSAEFQLGFYSELLTIIQNAKANRARIKQSGWAKIYEQTIEVAKSSYKQKQNFLLLSIPKNPIRISINYKDLINLQNKSLVAPEFILHELSSESDKITDAIEEWVKKLAYENIISLIGGTVLDVFKSFVGDIITVVRFVISCFIGGQ